MAAFAGLQVSVGRNETNEPRLINVPVHYGAKDRVVAAILAENTQNAPLRLPIMSCYVSGIDIAPELQAGISTVRRETFLPPGGMIPDDIQTIRQLKPIPYRVNMELAIYASNTDQHFQIMEQILLLFNPGLQVQLNDAPFDWTKITTIELIGIRLEQNYPSQTDRRIIQSSLDFQFPIYLSAPAELKNNYVRDVYARIGKLSDKISSVHTSYDIVYDLDEQGVEYNLIVSGDELKIS
jgi:hypothetical protein